MHYLGLRGFIGGGDIFGPLFVLGAELVLAQLTWRRFYWEVFRANYGAPLGVGFGTAIGYPIRYGAAGKHLLRVGLHLTAVLAFPWMVFSASGLQLTYQYRWRPHLAFEVGLFQYSWPFSVALSAGVAF